MDPVSIEVTNARATYRVVVGRGLAARPAEWLPAEAGVRVVVSCPPVLRALGRKARRLTPGAPIVTIPDGERAKSLRTVAGLYDAFLRRRLDRTGASPRARSPQCRIGGGIHRISSEVEARARR